MYDTIILYEVCTYDILNYLFWTAKQMLYINTRVPVYMYQYSRTAYLTEDISYSDFVLQYYMGSRII